MFYKAVSKQSMCTSKATKKNPIDLYKYVSIGFCLLQNGIRFRIFFVGINERSTRFPSPLLFYNLFCLGRVGDAGFLMGFVTNKIRNY